MDEDQELEQERDRKLNHADARPSKCQELNQWLKRWSTPRAAEGSYLSIKLMSRCEPVDHQRCQKLQSTNKRHQTKNGGMS